VRLPLIVLLLAHEFLEGGIVAFVPEHVVTFEGEDVRGDAVEEPAVIKKVTR
jgi:hypothetical protein